MCYCCCRHDGGGARLLLAVQVAACVLAVAALTSSLALALVKFNGESFSAEVPSPSAGKAVVAKGRVIDILLDGAEGDFFEGGGPASPPSADCPMCRFHYRRHANLSFNYDASVTAVTAAASAAGRRKVASKSGEGGRREGGRGSDGKKKRPSYSSELRGGLITDPEQLFNSLSSAEGDEEDEGRPFDFVVSYLPGSEVRLAEARFRPIKTETTSPSPSPSPSPHRLEQNANWTTSTVAMAASETSSSAKTKKRWKKNRSMSRVVATIIDRCRTPSNREGYLAEISKHVSVHTYGPCGERPCPGDGVRDCLVALDRRGYDFLLVLEPHLCQHYQSGLLWTALRHATSMVPVVFGGVDYAAALLPSGRPVVIDALSQDPRTLATYLDYLHRHPSVLDGRYRYWRSEYRIETRHWTCSLCDKVRRSAIKGQRRPQLERPLCTRWPSLDFGGL